MAKKAVSKTGNAKPAAAKKKRVHADEKAALGDELKADAKTGELFETQNVSRTVKTRANKYRDLMVDKSKSLAAFNAARDSLIEAMEADGCERVLIDIGGVRKWVVCEHAGSVKTETVKDAKDNDD